MAAHVYLSCWSIDNKILEFKRVPKPNPATKPPIKNSENSSLKKSVNLIVKNSSI